MGPYKALLLGWWVYPLLYGNNGSLDPGTYKDALVISQTGNLPQIGMKIKNIWVATT